VKEFTTELTNYSSLLTKLISIKETLQQRESGKKLWLI